MKTVPRLSARAARNVLAGFGLAAVYLLLLPSIRLGDVLVASLLSLAVLWASRYGAPASRSIAPSVGVRPSAPFRIPSLAAHLVAAITHGTKVVLEGSLSTDGARRSTIMELPISELRLQAPDSADGETELHRASLLGLVDSLSPGTILVDVDADQMMMLFHVVGRTPEQHTEALRSLWKRHLTTFVQFPPASGEGPR